MIQAIVVDTANGETSMTLNTNVAYFLVDGEPRAILLNEIEDKLLKQKILLSKELVQAIGEGRFIGKPTLLMWGQVSEKDRVQKILGTRFNNQVVAFIISRTFEIIKDVEEEDDYVK